MTNPLPESAVELAAIELAKKWNLWPADAERMAREAIRAALPAIREAVVGELIAENARLREYCQSITDWLAAHPAFNEQETRNG